MCHLAVTLVISMTLRTMGHSISAAGYNLAYECSLSVASELSRRLWCIGAVYLGGNVRPKCDQILRGLVWQGVGKYT